jgi:HlyD family secretion protein
MKKYVRIGVIVLIAGLFVFTLFFLYQKSKPKVVEVKTKTPFIGNVIKKTVATGSVVLVKKSRLSLSVWYY